MAMAQNLHLPSREQKLERERQIWALRCQGYTQRRISEALGMKQPNVQVVLKRLNAYYLNNIMADIAGKKAEQEAQLEHIIDEALQAWERSKAPKRTVHRKIVNLNKRLGDEGQAPSGDVQTVDETVELVQEQIITTIEEQAGDSQHLEMARRALADIRKIFGMDAKPTVSQADADALMAQVQREASKLAGMNAVDVRAVIAEAERMARHYTGS